MFFSLSYICAIIPSSRKQAIYLAIVGNIATICLHTVCICVIFVEDMNEAQYPIQLVARLTGLSAHVIRIWEQRYRAVEPQRTATKRRLYSRRDIERLSLLRDVIHAGHSIGQIAQLPTDKLGKLVAASSSFPAPAARAQIVFIS
jgi:hypothetical protein